MIPITIPSTAFRVAPLERGLQLIEFMGGQFLDARQLYALLQADFTEAEQQWLTDDERLYVTVIRFPDATGEVVTRWLIDIVSVPDVIAHLYPDAPIGHTIRAFLESLDP